MIIRFSQSRLSNGEHFQHKTDIKALLEGFPKVREQMGTLPAEFLALYAEEDKALEYIIAKSDYTQLINNKCSERKTTIVGLFGHIDSGTRHFNPEYRQEAISLQNVKNVFRDMVYKGISAQTAATYNFLQEMAARSAMLEHLHLTDWVSQLDKINKEVTALVKTRDEERAKQQVVRMDVIRPAIDKSTEAVYEALNAFSNMFRDDADIMACVSGLNVINKRYADTLAQHEGRLAAAAGKKKRKKNGETIDEALNGEE